MSIIKIILRATVLTGFGITVGYAMNYLAVTNPCTAKQPGYTVFNEYHSTLSAFQGLNSQKAKDFNNDNIPYTAASCINDCQNAIKNFATTSASTDCTKGPSGSDDNGNRCIDCNEDYTAEFG